eukprot:9954364-Alexandrium_andersonii.AAC.1
MSANCPPSSATRMMSSAKEKRGKAWVSDAKEAGKFRRLKPRPRDLQEASRRGRIRSRVKAQMAGEVQAPWRTPPLHLDLRGAGPVSW